MADGASHPHPLACPRCKAQRDAVPPEAALRIIATEDWSEEAQTFVVRSMNQEQAVAAEMLTVALHKYWSAFGTPVTGARLTSFIQAVRFCAKNTVVQGRVMKARARIIARGRERELCGDMEGAERIYAEPTPDYPQKAADEAWLTRNRQEAPA